MGKIGIALHPAYFERCARRLLESEHFRVETFVFPSGVLALGVRNTRGSIIVLPFRGQQIWRAAFDGRELTMKSGLGGGSGRSERPARLTSNAAIDERHPVGSRLAARG